MQGDSKCLVEPASFERRWFPSASSQKPWPEQVHPPLEANIAKAIKRLLHHHEQQDLIGLPDKTPKPDLLGAGCVDRDSTLLRRLQRWPDKGELEASPSCLISDTWSLATGHPSDRGHVHGL